MNHMQSIRTLLGLCVLSPPRSAVRHLAMK
jgi:hypothetical protein